MVKFRIAKKYCDEGNEICGTTTDQKDERLVSWDQAQILKQKSRVSLVKRVARAEIRQVNSQIQGGKLSPETRCMTTLICSGLSLVQLHFPL